MRYREIRIYSCYVSPNISITEYIEYLEKLEVRRIGIRSENGEVILAGDFNAKNVEWGSATNDQRGDELSALIATLDLFVCSRESMPTFKRGASSSVLDVTFASQLTALVTGWMVLNKETRSDHNYLCYNVETQTGKQNNAIKRWSWRKLDTQKLKEYLQNNNTPTEVSELMEVLTSACDTSMSKQNYTQRHHKTQYWWTKEIADMRKSVFASRRCYQRTVR